jgi:exodeoxyribonuclease V gamma subunit
MENLVLSLADALKVPLKHPLASEVIVVQSKGMQRWVTMELAKHFGIWANGYYPFPNAMVGWLFGLVFPDLPDEDLFSREVMTWKIIGLLPEFLGREDFTPLRHYLSGDNNGLKRFQLAERIAHTFDQYTLFRPEMLKEWESSKKKGQENDWQAILWREIVAGTKGRHRGKLKEDFCRLVETEVASAGKMPERISLFGVSYLPKYHMEILTAIVRVTEVNLFVLSPTREYWSDIISRREQARLNPANTALRIEGNPLLASLGKLGRDFSDMIIEIADVAIGQQDQYEDPPGHSLLHHIQSDILNLRGAGAEVEKQPIDPDDVSVQIHSCHSPMREIEVLYDNLLALLERTDGLSPRDIVVMTPDIEIYAPYISAVFDGSQESSLKIPYSIADRRLRSEGQIADVFLKLLSLPGSRFTVVQVFDILSAEPVKKRFDLHDEELEILRGWIENTSIRWGLDEHSRSRLELPGYRENTWRAGLDRLLLGYAMTDDQGRTFNGKLPYDDLEGSETKSLGKLADFIDRIGAIDENLARPHTLFEWRNLCRALVADFILAGDDMASELATLNSLITDMGDLGEQSGFDGKVEPGVIRAWLTARLDQEEKGFGFMTGGVTFCAMLPMRSIPFRMVALIGMSDGAFPRQDNAPGFDLIARNHRRGDHSRRDEDRYMFLESILSVRDCLYISYLGQSMKDNSGMPPSVLVSELMDAIERSFTAGNNIKIEDRLVKKHRLQAFSRDYFAEDSPLFSYSEENYKALLEKQSQPDKHMEFLKTPLEEPPEDEKDIPLIRLLRFFDNPAKYFLENRMKIRLEDIAAPLDEREPFAVEGLELYGLRKEILDLAIQGRNARDFFDIARCRGIIPPARHGEIVFENACCEVDAFVKIVQGKFNGENPLASLDFELDLSGFRLTGRLDGIWPSRMIRYRLAKLKAKDRVGAWILHLVLNAVCKKDFPRETLLIMSDGLAAYRPVENAGAILKSLLDLYWQGLTLPLRFFPESAMAYAEQAWDVNKARAKWDDAYNDIPGEGRDPYFRLCFGRVEPFNEEFEKTARALLEPLLLHQVKERP